MPNFLKLNNNILSKTLKCMMKYKASELADIFNIVKFYKIEEYFYQIYKHLFLNVGICFRYEFRISLLKRKGNIFQRFIIKISRHFLLKLGYSFPWLICIFRNKSIQIGTFCGYLIS